MGRHTSILFFLSTFAMGCGCGVEPEPEDECVEVWDAEFAGGPAAWDGFRLDVEREGCFEGDDFTGDEVPLIHDADGDVVAVEPVGACPRWQPDGGFEPGDYEWAGLEGADNGPLETVEGPLTFTIDDAGRDPDFDPTTVTGAVYRVDLEGTRSCSAAPWGAWGHLFLEGEVLLQVLEVADGQASFRLVRQPLEADHAPTCVMLEDDGALTDQGELSWSRAFDEALTEPPVAAWDLGLRVGFDADGQGGRGFEAQGVASLEFLVAASITPDLDDACNLAASFGLQCEACPDGGEGCLPVEIFGGEITLADDVTLDEELEYCFATIEGPEFEWDTGWTAPECEPSCAGTGSRAGFLGLWSLLLAVVVRRRGR